jgi:hypothetical protein
VDLDRGSDLFGELSVGIQYIRGDQIMRLCFLSMYNMSLW